MATKLEKVEAVTVGVGWAGGIVAAELAKKGFNVLGLEKGKDDYKTEDFQSKHDELRYYHRLELMGSLSENTVTFRNTVDQTAKPVRDQTTTITGEGAGGGGNHWAAQTHRYFPYDFEIDTITREKYGEDHFPDGHSIQDWGITYEELEPYYVRIENTMGTSGEESEYEAPRKSPFPTPPHKRSNSLSTLYDAAERLGYHPFMTPTGTVSEEWENPDGQVLNACQLNGFCSRHSCEYGARATPITTVIPAALETGNFELRTNSMVTRILHKDGKATGVLYRDMTTGEEFEQPADLVALTSFTFNNTKLMLLSEIGEPYNPKTGQGVIGKNFTDHHSMPGVQGFFDEQKFNKFIGSGTFGVVVGDLNADNYDHSDVDFIHGGQVQLGEQGIRPIQSNDVPEGTASWGAEFKKQSIFYFNRTITLSTQMATMSYKNNYLDLDPTYKDINGDPLVRVTFDFGDNEKKVAKRITDLCLEIMEEMGATHTKVLPLPEHFSPGFAFQHNGGGVIMGDDPETSAVNNYLQVWDMENLFVCGASAFPQFGATNPTLTLGALTYRATEGMIKYLNGEEGMLVEAKKKTKTTLA